MLYSLLTIVASASGWCMLRSSCAAFSSNCLDYESDVQGVQSDGVEVCNLLCSCDVFDKAWHNLELILYLTASASKKEFSRNSDTSLLLTCSLSLHPPPPPISLLPFTPAPWTIMTRRCSSHMMKM